MLRTIQELSVPNPYTDLLNAPNRGWQSVVESLKVATPSKAAKSHTSDRPQPWRDPATEPVAQGHAATKQELQTQITQLNAELDRAKAVQSIFYPQVPEVPGLSISVESRAAHQLNGDYYDFIKQSRDRLIFSVGDVCSKGAAAALLMPIVQRSLRAGINMLAAPTPQALLAYMNADMYDEFARSTMFATSFVGQFDPNLRRLRYINAGQSPVIYRPHDGAARMLAANALPLGILAENHTTNEEIPLRPDDLLIIGTDGLAEARDQDGEQFGYPMMLQLANQLADLPVHKITEELFARIKDFRQSRQQEDDQTLMVIKGSA